MDPSWHIRKGSPSKSPSICDLYRLDVKRCGKRPLYPVIDLESETRIQYVAHHVSKSASTHHGTDLYNSESPSPLLAYPVRYFFTLLVLEQHL